MSGGRRQFLRGTGGVVLGLPFLPSLLPRGANALATEVPPRLVMMQRTHGALHDRNDVDDTLLPNRETLFPGHEMRWGPLAPRREGDNAVVSRVVQAHASTLDERMIARLNVIRGLDLPNAINDHCEWPFGAIGYSRFRDTAGVPSIDQLAAWSTAYHSGNVPPVRSINVGGESFSFHFENPVEGAGRLNQMPVEGDPTKLFEALFLPDNTGEPPPEEVRRTPLVDHVLQDYRSMRNANRQLSSADRQRLDAHMEMLLEVQRRAQAAGQLSEACVRPTAPQTPSPLSANEHIALYQTYNDLIAAAFKCGVSRIATVSPEMYGYDIFNDPAREWHAMHHAAYGGTRAADLVAQSKQTFLEHIFLDLALKLDVEEADGRTFLDNTFMLYTSEQGAKTHTYTDHLMVTLGDACGHFATGRYLDYRNRDFFLEQGYRGSDEHPMYPGLPIHRFWANLLDALQIPRSEWARYADGGGYGSLRLNPNDMHERESINGDATVYVPGVLENAGDRLPVLVS